MQLRHLRYFLAVAEAGSMTAAAERLHVAQPSLSRQMRDLERDLGRELLIRTPHGVSLTAAGEVLQAQARAFVELERSTESLVRQAGDDRAQLTVGLGAGLGHLDLEGLVDRARAAVPGLGLSFEQHGSLDQLGLLTRGRLDLCLLHEPAGDEVASRKLERRPIGLAVRPGHPLQGLDQLELADLSGLAILIHSDEQAPTLASGLRSATARAGVEVSWQSATFFEYVSVAAHALEADAVALTEVSARRGLPGWSWLPVRGMDVERVTWLAWRRDARDVVRRVASALAPEPAS